MLRFKTADNCFALRDVHCVRGMPVRK